MPKIVWKISATLICIASAVTWFYLNTTKEIPLIRIATNPWPGYEFLHIASKKGFFTEEGLNVQLVRFTSLEDARRAFELGKVDGMTSTLVELMQAHEHGVSGKIAFVTDYSDGGDMVIAQKNIKSVLELKGKTIAIEPATLSALFISRALNQFGLSLADVKLEGMNPLDMEAALLSGQVGAAHSYPPAAFSILKHTNKFHKIFDSSQLQKKIIDVVVLRDSLLERHPHAHDALVAAWDKALTYSEQNPQETFKNMADLEGITVEEFKQSLTLVKVLRAPDSKALMGSPEFIESINEVGKFLQKDGALKQLPPEGTTFLVRDKTTGHD